MSEFLCKTFTPEIFWTAFSSLATFLAVLVALFLPIYTKKQEYKSMKKLIYIEFHANINLLKKIQPFNKVISIDNAGNKINSTEINKSMFRELRLSIWNEYKFRLSLYNAEVYTDLEEYNRTLSDIINLSHSKEQDTLPFVEFRYNSLIESLKKSKYKDKI